MSFVLECADAYLTLSVTMRQKSCQGRVVDGQMGKRVAVFTTILARFPNQRWGSTGMKKKHHGQSKGDLEKADYDETKPRWGVGAWAKEGQKAAQLDFLELVAKQS